MPSSNPLYSCFHDMIPSANAVASLLRSVGVCVAHQSDAHAQHSVFAATTLSHGVTQVVHQHLPG
jgi:hypothetical protein